MHVCSGGVKHSSYTLCRRQCSVQRKYQVYIYILVYIPPYEAPLTREEDMIIEPVSCPAQHKKRGIARVGVGVGSSIWMGWHCSPSVLVPVKSEKVGTLRPRGGKDLPRARIARSNSEPERLLARLLVNPHLLQQQQRQVNYAVQKESTPHPFVIGSQRKIRGGTGIGEASSERSRKRGRQRDTRGVQLKI